MEIALKGRTPTVVHEIDAPAADVWRVLTDLDAWPRWGPTVARAELAAPGPVRLGARGRIWTPVGVPLPFEISEFDAGRRWGWKVAGIEATRHGVDPDGTGSVAWMSAPLWAPAYLPVLAVALRRIEKMLR
jgi:hypothetical protein